MKPEMLQILSENGFKSTERKGNFPLVITVVNNLDFNRKISLKIHSSVAAREKTENSAATIFLRNSPVVSNREVRNFYITEIQIHFFHRQMKPGMLQLHCLTGD